MSPDRRQFLNAGICLSTALLTSSSALAIDGGQKLRVVAFDAFAVFDGRSVVELAEKLFPGNGVRLADAWRQRQFEYTWLRTLAGKYRDFMDIIHDA